MVYPVSCTAVCYVTAITLFIQKVGVVRPNFGGSGPPPNPPVVAPLVWIQNAANRLTVGSAGRATMTATVEVSTTNWRRASLAETAASNSTFQTRMCCPSCVPEPCPATSSAATDHVHHHSFARCF